MIHAAEAGRAGLEPDRCRPKERGWTQPYHAMEGLHCLHQRGIGVIIDWVPAHFPKGQAGGPGLALARRNRNQKGAGAVTKTYTPALLSIRMEIIL